MRIRRFAVPTGIAVLVMVTIASPGYAATTHHQHRVISRQASTVSGADDSTGSGDTSSTGSGDSSGDASPTSSGFGTVTSYDGTSGQLVVATSAGGSVTAQVTTTTRLRLRTGTLAQSATGRRHHVTGTVTGTGTGTGDDSTSDTRAQRRTAALAALVTGATVDRLTLDPRTGALRALVIRSASTSSSTGDSSGSSADGSDGAGDASTTSS